MIGPQNWNNPASGADQCPGTKDSGAAGRPEPPASAGLRQLAAVRSLLSSDRRARECDILLSTAYEALLTGDKSTEELLAYIDQVWPGAAIDHPRLETALNGAAA